MFKKYQIGFDAWGFLLFVIVMIPNFIWFLLPAPDDILRDVSVTDTLDTVASVCQVLMLVALCVLRNRRSQRRATPFFAACAVCCLLYFISWGLYYAGIANIAIVLGLTVFPCLAFILFAAGRANMIAFTLAAIFTVCHLAHTAVNFIF